MSMKSYVQHNWHWMVLATIAALVIVGTGHYVGPEAAGAMLVAEGAGAATIEEVARAFEEFKKANDERLKQVEAKGRADPLLVGKVDKANTAIEGMLTKLEAGEAEVKAIKARADALEATLKRISTGAGGQANKVEAKHMAEYAAMYGIEVEKADEAVYVEHKKALQHYMRKGSTGKLAEFQAKAMSVDSNADGGYWVMPDTTGRIVTKVFESSPMRQYAAVQGISTDALEGDYDLDEAGSGWVSERGTRAETTTPQTGQWRIPTHELYAEPRATQKLLDDSMVDPEAWLSGKVSVKFARDEANAFVVGDGNGKPRGFLTYADGVPTKGAWKVIERVKTGVDANFAAAPAGPDIFFDLLGKMKDEYLNGAIWAMNRFTRAAARKLKDTDGNYHMQMDVTQGLRITILGFPVVAFNDMPNYNVADALAIAFGNFGAAYQIVDRIGIRVLRDPYTAKPYVKFYTTKRVGGDVINHEAIKVAQFGD
jgi:HK97 family phage major capsid protein